MADVGKIRLWRFDPQRSVWLRTDELHEVGKEKARSYNRNRKHASIIFPYTDEALSSPKIDPVNSSRNPFYAV
ncbi:hypothetical protein CEXT_768201 [Caerostris extrusa]|uniref:Uncharacterized protein n=1 Tax=Caerostris extrusa TaxID=172846 RepID=A0AAV4QSG1_CAEEX|nr:hypothetical protein CEXT_768201 [Caerostris extrusa]